MCWSGIKLILITIFAFVLFSILYIAIFNLLLYFKLEDDNLIKNISAASIFFVALSFAWLLLNFSPEIYEYFEDDILKDCIIHENESIFRVTWILGI